MTKIDRHINLGDNTKLHITNKLIKEVLDDAVWRLNDAFNGEDDNDDTHLLMSIDDAKDMCIMAELLVKGSPEEIQQHYIKLDSAFEGLLESGYEE